MKKVMKVSRFGLIISLIVVILFSVLVGTMRNGFAYTEPYNDKQLDYYVWSYTLDTQLYSVNTGKKGDYFSREILVNVPADWSGGNPASKDDVWEKNLGFPAKKDAVIYKYTEYRKDKMSDNYHRYGSMSVKELVYKDVKKTRWVNENVEFQKEDGTTISTATGAQKTMAISLPQSNLVEKTGYTLTNWHDKINGTNYALSSFVYADSNNKAGRVLIPQYKANSYTIKFDGNGNTSGTMNNQAMTYDSPAMLSTNSFVKDGYTFAGWKNADKIYTNEESVNNLTAVDGEIVTLEAQWDINYYDVTFEDNDGTELKTEKVAYGMSANAPENPKKVGYTFNEWDSDYSHIQKNLKVKATYDINHYSVKYDSDCKDKIDDKTGVLWVDNDLLPDSEIVKPGFTFEGWECEGKDVSDSTTYESLTKDDSDGTSITLKAKWKAKDYIVKYNLDGGQLLEGSKTELNIGYLDKVEMPIAIKKGYQFVGWTYQDKDVQANSYESIVGNDEIKTLELKAKWKVNSKENEEESITPDNNGSGGSSSNQGGTTGGSSNSHTKTTTGSITDNINGITSRTLGNNNTETTGIITDDSNGAITGNVGNSNTETTGIITNKINGNTIKSRTGDIAIANLALVVVTIALAIYAELVKKKYRVISVLIAVFAMVILAVTTTWGANLVVFDSMTALYAGVCIMGIMSIFAGENIDKEDIEYKTAH